MPSWPHLDRLEESESYPIRYMNETFIISFIASLCTAVVAVWTSYILLQHSKDEAILKAQERADLITLRAQERSDKLLFDQEQRINEEHKELMSATIRHYEDMFKVLEYAHGINRQDLQEETKKTKKVADKLTQSDIVEISSDMKHILQLEKTTENNYS